MEYKFYVKMDGDTFGPYTAKEVRDLQLLDDVLVTEESMNEWLPACRFDFDDMVRKELSAYVNEDGTINRPPSSGENGNKRGPIGYVPNEIKGWNWGAFFFSWIWGICNGVYWPLVLIVVNLIPTIGGVLSLIGWIILGINGNEWAWKGKNWSSIDEFKRVQHKWAIAILWVLGIAIFIGILGGIAAANS